MKIKLTLALALSLSVASSFAEDKTYLSCNEIGGDSGLSVQVLMKGGKAVIETSNDSDDEALVYVLLADKDSSGIKTILAEKSGTFVAQASEAVASNSFGQRKKSVMLRLLEGQKSAWFAANGSVFKLDCRR